MIKKKNGKLSEESFAKKSKMSEEERLAFEYLGEEYDPKEFWRIAKEGFEKKSKMSDEENLSYCFGNDSWNIDECSDEKYKEEIDYMYKCSRFYIIKFPKGLKVGNPEDYTDEEIFELAKKYGEYI